MVKLLVEDEDQRDSLILERANLNSNCKFNVAVSELENELHESTANLPLGKALTLLTCIHGHIFDKAVSLIRESSPNEIALKFVEMPTVRALISIENYLTSSGNVSDLFKHIYDSLQEKFIKRSESNSTKEQAMRIIGYFVLNSRHKKQVQDYICRELSHPNKRSQLAAVVLLEFLYTNYICQHNNNCDLAALLIPPLMKIVEEYGNLPTLLVCSSCALALQLSDYIAEHLDDPLVELESHQKVEVLNSGSEDKSFKIQQLVYVLNHTGTLFYMMEKWNNRRTAIETAAFAELHLIVQFAINHIENDEFRETFIQIWHLITTHLTPRSILSKKPISSKKQKSILSSQHSQNIVTTPVISIIKIILIVLLQKGRLLELYGIEHKSAISTTEEEGIKNLFTSEYKNVVQSDTAVTFNNIGENLIIQSVLDLPYLCSTHDITSTSLIQSIIGKVKYTTDTSQLLIPLAMRQPETSACNLLLQVLEQDERSKSSFEFLRQLVSQGSSEIIHILENNLLSVVKRSDQACELLIQCMPYTDLPRLIQILMLMSVVDNEREKMICVALISKALLVEKWSSNSVLIYIDLVRTVKSQKGFVSLAAKSNFADTQKMTPAEITAWGKDAQEISTKYSEYGMIDIESLKQSLNQLVYKSYGSPQDSIFINVWKQLSFAINDNHELIWNVMEPCVEIMLSQEGMPTTVTSDVVGVHLDLLKINPMLILQTIPKEVFDIVKLPKSYIDLLSDKFKMVDIDPSNIKSSSIIQSSTCTNISIQLMDELLSRSLLDTSQVSQNTTQFTIGLLTRIFCK